MTDLAAKDAAKLHVEEIRTRKFAIGKKEPNPLTQDLHHAVTSLSAELYTKDIHFLMELIQNAEDNEYPVGVQPSLEFVMTNRDITRTGAPSTLLIFNNEVGFSSKNMDSICSVGRSTKKGKRQLGFIGEKGIGFKSVFLVSKQPHIFSNGYQVKFSEAPNEVCGIGYIVPEWVEETTIVSDLSEIYGVSKSLPSTTIILPLKPEKVEAAKSQLSELHPELLLFLCKIKKLSVRIISNDPKEADSVSTIFVSSETDQITLLHDGIHSCVVHLSANQKLEGTEQTCRYFMWRHAFEVKPESKVITRNNVDKWMITLAFPLGERLKQGTSSVGIFAFLPTSMVTNFPFIIQADFILASSRETILLDNKWNMGILGCVPLAFFIAFSFCVKNGRHLFSVTQAFRFLPVQASSISELNKMRNSIKHLVQTASIIPCEMFSGGNHYCKPDSTIRIERGFRNLLYAVQKEGIPLEGVSLLKKVPVHSSLDNERFSNVLYYLGVVTASESNGWYAQCIQNCNFILQASDDAYVELLYFIAQMNLTSLTSKLRFLKYVDKKGEVKSCASTSRTILYAEADDHHAWLVKWNMQFGCPGGKFFLPISSQKAIISHKKRAFLCSWHSGRGTLHSYTVYQYAKEVCLVMDRNNEPKLAVDYAHFVYHSYCKGFISEAELYSLCKIMPIVDGSGCLRKQRLVTLTPANCSKWAILFGPVNPFIEQYYIDVGECYAESYQIVGEHTSEKELFDFLVQHFGAKDLPELPAPDMVLPLTSCLTSEQAFILLDWIRFLKLGGLYIPQKFSQGIRDGRWMKTYSGSSCPSQSVLLDRTGTVVFEMMKTVLDDYFILDQEFYNTRLCSYADELKYLGVRFGLDDLQKLLADRFKSLAFTSLSKEQTYSLLMFISIITEKEMIDQEWLNAIKEGKWLRTSQGYSAPKESLFLQLEKEAEAVLKFTKLPLVDESFYGSKLSTFSAELNLLGVSLSTVQVYDLIAENFTLPADVASITGNCGLLILRCLRYAGSAARDGFMETVMQQPWLKTTSGVESPSNCILRDVEWDSLYNIVDIPIIDEGFYESEIRCFTDELRTVGVAVDFDGAFELIIAQFKLLSSRYNLAPANINSLLICVREMIEKKPSKLSEFHSSLIGEMWLKTRHGYKAPNESILFSSKWATISTFVDLPFIDDCFYGIDIYAYMDELKLLGVVTDFTEGAIFVARGLKKPISTNLISRDSAISLLDCIKSLMSGCNDEHVFVDFLKNLNMSTWLKTDFGHRNPEHCILFDPAWEGILQRTDVPCIDETYYGTSFSVYKDQLRALGVKVDHGDVCSLLLGFLSSKSKTSCIERMYSFLSKFHINQESSDIPDSQVWIPSRNDAATEGRWVSSHLCVLYDKYKLFGSCMYALEDHYSKELLPTFTSIFGVAKFPSIHDYLQLWNGWASRSNSQVAALECFSFFGYVLDNWNPSTLETLKTNLTKLPATTCKGEEIYLVNKEEVFLPDDLQLKSIFEKFEVPLFTWFPRQCTLAPVFPWRLFEVYHSIGVRKISESVECKVDRGLQNQQSKMLVDPKNGFLEKGLLKIILAFLAGRMINMAAKERQKAVTSLLDLLVFETDETIEVNYQLLLCRRSRTLEAVKKKMVLWDRNSRTLLLDRSGFEDRKTNIEFGFAFAQEIAEGLLSQGPADAIARLIKIVQIGFMFEYKEDAVDFLLTKENLELYVEDTEFLNTAFGKQTCPSSKEQLGPLTPVTSHKRKRR